MKNLLKFVRKNKIKNNDYTILSQNISLDMNCRKTRRNNNVLVMGGAGSGKTRRFLLPNLLQKNCSYVVNDPYREIQSATKDAFVDSGYTVKEINFKECIANFNPFDFVRDDGDIYNISYNICRNVLGDEDEIAIKIGANLLQAAMFLLYHECRADDRNFKNVSKLLQVVSVGEGNCNYKTTADFLFEDTESGNPESLAVKCYETFKLSDIKRAKDVLYQLQSSFLPFEQLGTDKDYSFKPEDIAEFGRNPSILYVTSGYTPTATERFMKPLLYSLLIKTLYMACEKEEKLRCPIHVRFMLDEFCSVGYIENFDRVLSCMPKHNMSCTLIVQNLPQLWHAYKNSWCTIRGNCDTLVYLGCMEIDTLRYIKESFRENWFKVSTNDIDVESLVVKKKALMLNIGMRKAEFQQFDDWFYSMSFDECIVAVSGQPVLFDKKYDFNR